jgi:RNA polymerase sigma-70 factor (ECF subfamily)
MKDSNTTRPDHTALFNREFAPLDDDLFRYACWLTGDRSHAEDLVQETYLRVWRFLDSYLPGTNAKAWLFRICKNLFVNDYRRNGRQPHILIYEDWARSSEGANFLTDDPHHAAISEEVMLAINTLPERARIMVLLDVDFTYQEIADMLEVPIGTVRSTLHRARARLAKLLGEYARQEGYKIGVEPVVEDPLLDDRVG